MLSWTEQPTHDLELDAFERDYERRTQALEKLLQACGLSQRQARSMALKVLLHDPNFDINSCQYTNIKYVLKARARDLFNINFEPQNNKCEPVFVDVHGMVYV
ncbi:hypothetical protein [Scytonema hofmannii]|nr:hypothetical protein [Scytonema hofmannii]